MLGPSLRINLWRLWRNVDKLSGRLQSLSAGRNKHGGGNLETDLAVYWGRTLGSQALFQP